VAQPQETYLDKLAPAPAFILGWKIPTRRTPDHYGLSLAGDLLFSGDSSRLYQKLVKGDESVVSIQGEVDDRRGPSALYIFALPKPGEDTTEIRQQITNEIARLGTEGPSEEEMEKLRNTLCNDAVRGRQSTMYRAQRIAEHTIYDGDPTLFDHELDFYLQVTAEQIREVTAKYLNVENRVVLDIVPAAAAEEPETAAPVAALTAGDPGQPAAPPPQIPQQTEQPQLLEPPAQNEPGSEAVHPRT
jgi:predicted Zn-dependent peptidase